MPKCYVYFDTKQCLRAKLPDFALLSFPLKRIQEMILPIRETCVFLYDYACTKPILLTSICKLDREQ